MKFLKYLAFLGLASGLLLVVELKGERGQAEGSSQVAQVSVAAPVPVRTAYGTVRSIAGQALVLDIGKAGMTFVLGENTDIFAGGSGRPVRISGGGVAIADLVRTGDIALVAYQELKGSKRVLEIQVKDRKTVALR